MDNHFFCRGRLKMARYDAKYAGVKLPRLSSCKLSLDEYAVFTDDAEFDYSEHSACCAFDARTTVIYEIIDVRQKIINNQE